VVENARELVVDGFYVSWPEKPTVNAPHSVVWARGVESGVVNVPFMKPSHEGPEAVIAERCNCLVNGAEVG
jgi:hypothetical protein